MVHQYAAMMAALHGGDHDALLAHQRESLFHSQIAGRKGQAFIGVDQQRAALAPQHRRMGLAIDPAIAQVGGVLRHAREAMRGQALGFGQHQRARRAGGHDFIGTGAAQCGLRQFRGLGQAESAHGSVQRLQHGVGNHEGDALVGLGALARDMRREQQVGAVLQIGRGGQGLGLKHVDGRAAQMA